MSNDEQASGSPPFLPPHFAEIENRLLGAMLTYPEVLRRATEQLAEHDFYVSSNRYIFRAITRAYRKGQKSDLLSIEADLAKRSARMDQSERGHLRSLVEDVPEVSIALHYIDILADLSLRRRFSSQCDEAQALLRRHDMPAIEAIDLHIQRCTRAVSFKPWERYIPEWDIRECVDQIKSDAAHPGRKITSGIDGLDELTGGFHEGELTLFTGTPGVGKTALMLTMFNHVVMKTGKRAAFLSLRTPQEIVARRLLAIAAECPLRTIERNELSKAEMDSLERTAEKLSALGIHVGEMKRPTLTSLDERVIATKASMRYAQNDLACIFIDGLSGVQCTETGLSRRERLMHVVERAQLLAKCLTTPVIASVTIFDEDDGESTQTDICVSRSARSLHAFSDMLLVLDREPCDSDAATDNQPASLTVAKQLHGPPGRIPLVFEPRIASFTTAG